MGGGTLLIATRLANERAILAHWALSAGYWSIPLASESPLPPALPTPNAVLVFDESWGSDLGLASSHALRRGIAPIAVFGPRESWHPETILALMCKDFLRRPYVPDDAFARIRRALSEPPSHPVEASPDSLDGFEVGGLSVCEATRKASFRGQTVTLRRAECNVLVRLAKAFPSSVSQSEIVEGVLGAHGNGATARNQVYEVRRKLASIGAEGIIETLRGSGAYQIRLSAGPSAASDSGSDVDLTSSSRRAR